MSRTIESMGNFAKMCHDLLVSDRMVIIGVGGFPGAGKTRFSDALLREYSQCSNTYYDFDRMTWSRKEVIEWIDGKKNKQGILEGQLQEYESFMADELFTMFYKRNWYEKEQIDAITTFNMCRDRHLLLAGNIPNFWDLDSSFTNRVMFYVYIPKRGIAWVFEQENNPFSDDSWNKIENKKKFRKSKNPYTSPNFVCEIYYDDWTKEEKKRYYNIRNKKRLQAIQQNKTEKLERYSAIKAQRDATIRMLFNIDNTLTNKGVSEAVGISSEAIRLIRVDLR